MNSLEKLAKLQADLMDSTPTDEDSARWIQLGASVLPMLGPMLPADPAELDQQLLVLASWALSQRSDEASQYVVCELEGPPPPETHVIVLRTDQQDSGRVDILDVRFEPIAPGQLPAGEVDQLPAGDDDGAQAPEAGAAA